MHLRKMSAAVSILLLLLAVCSLNAFGQNDEVKKKYSKASKKVESGFAKSNRDTLAQGYFDLGESYLLKGELEKSEHYFGRSKSLYEKMKDAEGIAKSSRALAQVQESLNKKKEAISNYVTAELNTVRNGDNTGRALNVNDINRLNTPDSFSNRQNYFLASNINLGIQNKDTSEVFNSLWKMGNINFQNQQKPAALSAFKTAYKYSAGFPERKLQLNQRITDVYLSDQNFPKAIETKKEILNQDFVQKSSSLKAKEITSLADIYIKQKAGNKAIDLLRESYAISVANGHTIQAKESIEKMDSIFQASGKKDLSLQMYKDFLIQLPSIIYKDSSLADNRVVIETENRIRELETEKALKDDLIRRKNIFTYWLIGSVIALALFTAIVLIMLRKLRTKNKKIALQSLRREMNPHFIFNSLNSINQFIAHNNELAANQYLTKFSTLMRRVMENSTEDFVLFSRELELLQNYLELEKSRFPDKFDFQINVDESLQAEEHLYLPGMLIQPHLENAIWHGLRYMEDKGLLQLSFTRKVSCIEIIIEDNGIGIAESKKHKTENQKKRKGRGITNTRERIAILNELYRQDITCEVTDKPSPEQGVKVKISVPVLKKNVHED